MIGHFVQSLLKVIIRLIWNSTEKFQDIHLLPQNSKDNNNLIEKGLEMKGDYYKLYLE